MSIELIIDPEFKALIPPLTERELKNLEDSLITYGCMDPLVVWDRIIIDGHNRYEICRSRNIEFKLHEMNFESRDEAILWILRNQLSRRNLNDFQRIEIVRKCEKEVKAQAKKRQGTRNELKEHSGQMTGMLKKGKESRDELGAMAEVSGKTYERAVKVIDNAPEAVIAAVRKKDLSINSAYRVTKMSHEQQDEEHFGLTRKTFVLALDYFDRILSKTIVSSFEDIKQISILCVILASKFQENGVKGKKVENLSLGTSINYAADELFILRLLNYDLFSFTCYDFLKDILYTGFLFNDENFSLRKMDLIYEKIEDMLYFFSESKYYIEYTHKEIAISIIGLIRERLGLPAFSNNFQIVFMNEITNMHNYLSCLNRLRKIFKFKENANTKNNIASTQSDSTTESNSDNNSDNITEFISGYNLNNNSQNNIKNCPQKNLIPMK